jgi:ABC-type phosphate transport system permease subunit
MGSRITLFVVVLVAVLAAPIGLLVGTVAGYAGGWVDAVLMRITDIFLAFPRLILALAFVAALGPGIENAVIAIAITSWPPYARIARAETLTIRQADYIAAVQLIGASPWRIVLRHIMPLCVSSVIVRVTLDMAGIILTAAGLGFLGLGAQPPMPEWGAMIANGRSMCWTSGGWPPPRAPPSSWSAWPSTCWATACAMRWTRRDEMTTVLQPTSPSDPMLVVDDLRVAFPNRDGGWWRRCAACRSRWGASGWALWANRVRANHKPAAPFWA